MSDNDDDMFLLDESNPLGKGTFGEVFKTELEIDGLRMTVAVKKTVFDSVEAKRELTLMLLLKHANIICILSVRELESRLYLVLEYAENGALFDLLHPADGICVREFPLGRKLSWLQQTATALEYLHTMSVIHRDVKTQNILLCDNCTTVKFADFGLATIQRPQMSNFVGTPLWMAPEIFDEDIKETKAYDLSCDIYSFGIVMWEVVSGRLPFTTDSGMMIDMARFMSNVVLWYHDKVIVHGLRPQPLHGEPELDAIMTRAWDTDPKKRPTATELRNQLMVLKYE